MINIAIFASGAGSNAENIVHYFANNHTYNIKCIVSNKIDAVVHQRAKKLGIESVTFSAKQLHETTNLIDFLLEREIDFIVLAGFLLKIPTNIINKYPNRIINIHPALLPKFGGKGMYGLYVHEAVVASKEQETGITIHYINENYDEGDIIFQATCKVETSDSPSDVAQKVHALEYEYYPKIIEKVLGGLPDANTKSTDN